MSREVAILQSSDLSMGGVMMVEIPENEDKLTALILRTNSGVYGWLNACPHDGRSLCQDPVYLFSRKSGLIQCMHHQATFDPESGVCEDGPCVGEKLREVTTVEKDGQIAVLL
ncbi:MAG: Rieske (2Fe-2S) protein [Candidatus Thermoplasmatota archaeon]|nr:Rieske (2Fe-2S) protein [Candidatus Thermoplasmatota archaeon]